MMKKLRNLLILVVVLFALLGSLLYINLHPKKSASSSSTKIKLLTLDQKKIQKVEIASGVGNLTLQLSGTNWQTVPNLNYILDNTKITAILTSFSALNADSIVDKAPTDLSVYGLKSPITATAYLSDNTTRVIYLGNKTPVGSSYYLMVKDDPKVYAVAGAVGDSLSYKIDDIRNRALATIDTSTITYIKYSVNGGAAIEISKNMGTTDLEKTMSLSGYIMYSPYKNPVGADDQQVSSFISSLPSSITVSQFIGPVGNDLSKYGLDKPTLEATIKDGTNIIHLKVGKNKDSNNVYFMTDASDQVYTMDPSALSGFSGKAYDLVAKTFSGKNIDDVDKIVFDGRGSHHEAIITRSTKKAAKTGDPDVVTATYKIDGKDIKEAAFKSLFEGVTGLTSDSENSKTLTQNPEYTITYYLNKGTEKEQKYSFCTYDSDFDGIFLDGKSDFLISKQQIDKLVTLLQNTINGK